MTDERHKLGEVLREAREAKGADLARVERETKIRERYLSALERGEYRELPGSVYTKGFLRNYAAYLGLDPEYLIDLYRLETATGATERPAVPRPPRPISVRRRRTFVITPGAVAAAILTVLVGAFVAWLGYEFVNFARTPELRITDPAGDVSAHTGSTITLRGMTAPNATVTVSGLPENPSTTADAEGAFEVTVGLLPGSNEIHLVARDPVTNRSSEEFVRRVNVVSDADASPSPRDGAGVVLDTPEEGASVAGRLAFGGSAPPGTQVTVSVELMSAAGPSFTVVDGDGEPVELRPEAPTIPEALVLVADESGAFGGTISLAPGSWEVSVVGPAGAPVTRQVTIGAAPGVRAIVAVDGGETYLEASEDGTPVAAVSGQVVAAGERIDLEADRTITIRVGNAGAVRLTVNGLVLGPMGASGEVVTWEISRSDS